MRDFPSCFGENGVQVADASSSTSSSVTRTAQNLATCVYQCRLRNFSSFIVTVTWTKSLMGQGFSVEIEDSSNQSLCKVDIKPWLFSKRKGSRSLDVDSTMIDIYWDLCNAKFGSGPEPIDGFYLAVVLNQELVLLLGDLEKEVYKKIGAAHVACNAVFMSKKEHIFGKKLYYAKAQFCGKGQIHDIIIECDTVGSYDPCLVIRIDSKAVMQVKRLRWKFRGNYTILVDGLPVEVYWDVHGWLFGNVVGNAVFLFQTCLSAEKLWTSQSISNSSESSWSCSRIKEPKTQGLGFSLILCAWKSE